MAAAPPAPPGNFQAARPAYWFPLAFFGAIVALSVPLYAIRLHTSPAFSGWVAYAPLTRTVSSSSAHGGYSSTFAASLTPGTGVPGIAEGWYWGAALTAGFLVSAVWYRRAGRHAGRGAPGWGYLVTGLILTAGSRAQSAEGALLPAAVLLVAAAVAFVLPARFRGEPRAA